MLQFTHYGLVTSWACVNIGSGNGLSDGTTSSKTQYLNADLLLILVNKEVQAADSAFKQASGFLIRTPRLCFG